MRRLDIGLTFVAFVLSGCIATREWTHQLIGKHEVEIDDRVVKVETEVREHDERLDRVEVQVGQLDSGLTETRTLLRTALTQAAAIPQTSLPQASRPVTPRTSPSPGAPTVRRTLIGVVHVPFAFDRADLDPSAEAALAMIVKELREHPYVTIDLEGTTDPVGRHDYNVRLSQRRVETVQRWLVDKGVDRTRIVGSAGRGPLVDVAVQNNLKRRVVVKMLRGE